MKSLFILSICLFFLHPNVHASCSGTVTYNAPSGTFDDGSGPLNNYDNLSNCFFLISPGAGFHNITLSFNDFFTEDFFDFVYVYDGPTTASPLLGTFNGNILPPNITSTGNQILILFTSDNSVPKAGWSVNYEAHYLYCGGITTLTSPAGSFSDGSSSNEYALNSNCSWLIEPTGTFNTIALSFSNFNTEDGVDIVRVYDGPTTGSPLIGTFSGTTLPTTLHSTGTQMLVVFTSDAEIQEPGWDASYVTNCTPQVTINGQSTICMNETPSFTAVVVNGGTTPSYQWKINGTNAGLNSSSFSPGTFNEGDIISVEATSNETCAYPLVATNAVTIHIVNPSVDIVASSTIVCFGDAISLSGSGAATYSWDNGITDGLEFIPALGNTTYTVTGTDLNGCTATASIQITVNPSPLPVITSNTGSFTFCNCNSITLNAGNYNSYVWSTGATSRTLRVNSASTFTVIVTNSYSCIGSAGATTTVNNGKPSKPAAIAGPLSGLCTSNGNVYSISPITNAIYYEWCTTSGTIISGQNTTSVTINFGNFSSATISVKAVNKCGKSNDRELLVSGKPAKPLIINGIDKGVCKQNGVSYSIAPVTGANSYSWILPPGVLLLNGQGTTSITVKFLNSFSSSGNISVKARNNCGSGPYASLKVHSSPRKPAGINGPNGVCQNQTNINYSISPVFGAINYTWIVPPGSTIISGQGTTSIIMNFGSQAGEVKVKARNNCGSSSYREMDVTFICREATITHSNNNIKVFPNPVHDHLNLEIFSDQNQKCNLKMFDLLGKQILSDAISLVDGNNHFSIDMNFSKGIYIMVIERAGLFSETVRVVVE